MHAQGIRPQKDSIFLFNGQLLIGEIKNCQMGVLTIDETDLKIITIKLYKVRRIVAETDIFRIETNDRHIYFSQLHPSPTNNHCIVDVGTERRDLSLLDISDMVALEKNFWKRLDGNLGIGFSFTKSSDIGQLTVNSTVYYAARKLEYQLTASAISSLDSGKLSRDNEALQLFSNYNFTTNWFGAGQIYYQRNLELAIARRLQGTLGAGNKLLVHKEYQLLAISGLSVSQEKSTTGEQSVQFEIPVMFRFNFFRYQHPNIQVSAYQSGFVSMSDWGRFRYDGNLNFSLEIVHNFYLSLNFYSNFDNRPPDGSTNKFDYGTSSTISYKF
ncbi:DUF481 domain-containing protein [Flavihumibacter petaseus]|uniref:DUF481 domain-containing protein n=1 Tax=Flavihumibacter petaseus NBRC 106054 TaxID=1220578 RepID=A0A0E9MVF1_9BACT|nr:DUF481 domain-containing protein [Flavihumibacter petaseus]GAO41110.1 hypothetical protein FPE01S_01_01220 [Flavihumibacter petaseus NBRC 106054]